MFNDKPMPFYLSYPMPNELENSGASEREWGVLRSWYTGKFLQAQEAVEQVLDELDYEGSWIYDEYPDRNRMEQAEYRVQEELDRKRGVQMEAQGRGRRKIEDYLRLLWYQELFRRRCRRKTCRRYF